MRAYTISLLLILTAGCSSSEPDERLSPEAVEMLNDLADAKDEAPKCRDVWRVGAKLPKGYEGCLDGDTIVAPIAACDDGKVAIYETPGHGFFVDRSGTIRDEGDDYANSAAHTAALEGC